MLLTLYLCAKAYKVKLYKYIMVNIISYCDYERFRYDEIFYFNDSEKDKELGFVLCDREDKVTFGQAVNYLHDMFRGDSIKIFEKHISEDKYYVRSLCLAFAEHKSQKKPKKILTSLINQLKKSAKNCDDQHFLILLDAVIDQKIYDLLPVFSNGPKFDVNIFHYCANKKVSEQVYADLIVNCQMSVFALITTNSHYPKLLDKALDKASQNDIKDFLWSLTSGYGKIKNIDILGRINDLNKYTKELIDSGSIELLGFVCDYHNLSDENFEYLVDNGFSEEMVLKHCNNQKRKEIFMNSQIW